MMLSPVWFLGSAVLAIVMTLILFILIVSPITKCTTSRAFIFSMATSIGWSICACLMGLSAEELSMEEILVRGIGVWGIFSVTTMIFTLSWRAWAKWVSPHLE